MVEDALASDCACCFAGAQATAFELPRIIVLMAAPACADILGIDGPQKRAAAEVSGAGGSPAGGDAGASGNSGPAGSAGLDRLKVVTPVGGGPAEAGSGGISGAAGNQNSPTFSCAQTTPACPGAEAMVNLTASGGVPPYRWELLESDPAFTLRDGDADTAQATVTGAPASSGTYPLRIQVTDAMNKPFERRCDVSVLDVPVIDQASVPSVCPGELYSVRFAAHGGDASSYQWTIPDLPQSTGLEFASGLLSGKFLGAPHDADHLNFTLQLSDSESSSAQCGAASVKLTLNLETPSSLVCTSVGVDKQVAGKPPPGPCIGNPYNETLVVRRGIGATTMAASALPSGLSFDPAPPPEFELMLHYGSDGSLPVLRDGVVVAPSGHYTARPEDHSLALFRAIDDSFPGDPYDQIAGCDSVCFRGPITPSASRAPGK